MKTFTKVMLILSGIFATIGVVCIVIACSMGLTWGTFKNMVHDGKFRIDFGSGLNINFFGNGIHIGSGEGESGQEDITDEIRNLDIEFGAGILDIRYGDVEQIHVEYEYIISFESSVKNGTLRLEGAVGAGDNSDGALVIVIPQGMKFDKVDLEIGACEATIQDLVADEVKVSVGVGEAKVRNLTTSKLDAEAGIGALAVELVGKQSEYSYNVDCGIGAVTIGSNTYGGLGAETSVKVDNAVGQIDVDCGIGEVKITFTE
ncbi:MAG: hypothetical protein J6B96_04915 [Agathobacter sp.]|nr:hypothetical protein [Agathobacter sp.]